MPTSTVSFGPSSIIGFIAAAAAAIIPLIGELADSLNPLGVPQQTWIVVSAILTAVTVVGRMYQAGQQAGSVITEPVPEDGGADEPEGS